MPSEILVRIKFQLILPVDSQNVTKNKTDRVMHVEVPQICQINHWNNSFQNIYGMPKATIDCLARKIDFVQKKPQTPLGNVFVC